MSKPKESEFFTAHAVLVWLINQARNIDAHDPKIQTLIAAANEMESARVRVIGNFEE